MQKFRCTNTCKGESLSDRFVPYTHTEDLGKHLIQYERFDEKLVLSYKSIRRTTTTVREEKDMSSVRGDNTSNEKQRHVLLSFCKLLKIASFKINSSSTDWFTWMKCIIGIH